MGAWRGERCATDRSSSGSRATRGPFASARTSRSAARLPCRRGSSCIPGDAYGQTREAIAKALAAAAELGASVADVIRTRLLLAEGSDWHAAVRAHGEAFAGIDPANTTYFVAGFIPEGVLVEVELDAIVADWA